RNQQANWDLWTVGVDGRNKPSPLLQTRFDEEAAAVSPDGRWLAYVRNQTGRPEIYVRPFASPAGKTQVANNGGREPAWARDGQELFYREGATGGRMMS